MLCHRLAASTPNFFLSNKVGPISSYWPTVRPLLRPSFCHYDWNPIFVKFVISSLVPPLPRLPARRSCRRTQRRLRPR